MGAGGSVDAVERSLELREMRSKLEETLLPSILIFRVRCPSIYVTRRQPLREKHAKVFLQARSSLDFSNEFHGIVSLYEAFLQAAAWWLTRGQPLEIA